MTNELSRTILNHVDGFPALPATVSNVITITGNPESSAQDLMKAVLPDQAMCLTILKIANSAFFGLPRTVSTIDKAVMVLGFNEIRNIVLGKAVFNSFQDAYRDNREQISIFWEHSFLTGLAAKIIAEDIKISPSEAFIAGLIHDIGKLAMLVSLNGDYSAVFESSFSDPVGAYLEEQERLSIGHDEVGYRLLKRWLFPKSLLDTTGYHHKPLDSAGDSLFPAVIELADAMSHLHRSEDDVDSSDLASFFANHIPDVKTVWNDYDLEWNDSLFARWQQELLVSSDRDRAILTIITM
jgi:HD-like signal output (HDOD) protein